MKIVRVLIGCTLAMAWAISVMAQSVRTDYDRSFNLSQLKTFDFARRERTQNDPLSNNPINDRRIHDALDTQLRAQGFTTGGDQQPDFFISYFVTTRAGFDIQDNRIGILQRGGSINVSQVTEGTIVVSFKDSATQREIWRGYVSATIDQKHLDRDVNKGIAKLVQRFVKDQAGKK
jgi:hypothetical protein